MWITCGLNMHFTHPCWRGAINHPEKTVDVMMSIFVTSKYTAHRSVLDAVISHLPVGIAAPCQHFSTFSHQQTVRTTGRHTAKTMQICHDYPLTLTRAGTKMIAKNVSRTTTHDKLRPQMVANYRSNAMVLVSGIQQMLQTTI